MTHRRTALLWQLALAVRSWWVPYIFGASEAWAGVYARNVAASIAVLPRWGNHLPPDALHVVLQALLFGAVVTGTRAIAARTSRSVRTDAER